MFRSTCVCAIAVSDPGLNDRFGFPLEYYAAQHVLSIGEPIKTGKTETKIDLLAIRRVQLRIDRELKAIGRKTA
ncbi:hypothetical protein ACVIQY_006419 [Bradyrhizobium sp. USDA 3051]